MVAVHASDLDIHLFTVDGNNSKLTAAFCSPDPTAAPARPAAKPPEKWQPKGNIERQKLVPTVLNSPYDHVFSNPGFSKIYSLQTALVEGEC